MKKILLASALFCTVFGAQAQEGTSVERATDKTEKLNEEVTLNAEQMEKVQTVFEGIEMKNESIQNDASMSKDQKTEILEGNKSAEVNMLQSILTEEQYIKYKMMNQPLKPMGPAKKIQTTQRSTH